MSVIIFVLLVAAFICFVLAAFGVAATRINLVALGLACWVLTAVITAWPKG